MAVFLVLVGATAALRVLGLVGVDALDAWEPALRCGLAFMLCLTASVHFDSRRRDPVAMVPPSLPRPTWLVAITGVLELLVAVGLIFPRTPHRRRRCSCCG